MCGGGKGCKLQPKLPPNPMQKRAGGEGRRCNACVGMQAAAAVSCSAAGPAGINVQLLPHPRPAPPSRVPLPCKWAPFMPGSPNTCALPITPPTHPPTHQPINHPQAQQLAGVLNSLAAQQYRPQPQMQEVVLAATQANMKQVGRA